VKDQSHFTIINTSDRRILREMLPLAKPISLFVEPTNRCNFRCVCCGHGNERTRNDLKPLINMDTELYRKIIRELSSWEGPPLRLLRLAVLGEPLVHPDFLEMVRLANTAGIADKVDTFSNGSLLTEAISIGLVENGLDSIRFSIYAVDPDRHRKVTQTQVDVSGIRANIRRLREIRDRKGSRTPRIVVKMFDTYGEENDLFRRQYEGIADEIDFENVNDATRYNGTDLVGAFYGDAELAKRIRSSFRKHLHRHAVCPRPFMALVVCSNGSVVMCTHDYPRATMIGNVKDSTLEEIWNSRALFEFRKMLLLGEKRKNILCRNCVWYKLFPEEDNVDGLPVELFIPKAGPKA